MIVPGVGDGTNLCQDWIPEASNLYEAARVDGRRPVEGLRQPGRHPGRGGGVDRVQRGPGDGRLRPDRVHRHTGPGPEQSLTVIAHSFGSIVTGAALADAGLQVTDVVVAGSPGMTVDGLRQLHLQQSHFFSEQAPGDAIAELGVFGAVAHLAAFRRHADEHQRARAHPGHGALALLRPGLGRAGEHGRRRHRAVRRDPAAPGCLSRDRRRPRGLGPAHAGRRRSARWDGTTAGPGSGSW